MKEFPECDWKAMRKMSDELLEELAERINRRSREILDSELGSALDRHRMLYRHIKDADKIVGECFDDWRRSTLFDRIFSLRRHGLLTDERLQRLSEEGRELVRSIDERNEGLKKI